MLGSSSPCPQTLIGVGFEVQTFDISVKTFGEDTSPHVPIHSSGPATVQCGVSRVLKNWKFNFEPNPICWKKGFICSSANNLSRKKREKSSTTGGGGHFQYDNISSLHTEITAFKLSMTTLVKISGARAHSLSADFRSKVWACHIFFWSDLNWLACGPAKIGRCFKNKSFRKASLI